MVDASICDHGGESIFFRTHDGLKLHMRDYGGEQPALRPVVCLPGLARPAADFDLLARRLAKNGRRVVALDYRGRGCSDYDADWRRYDLPTESTDILTVLEAADIRQAVFIGTSRGGLHIFRLAALESERVAGAVLNDIGPVIEPEGLKRIKSYVGKLKAPRDWPEATEIVRQLLGSRFPQLSEADAEAYARLTFTETPQGFVTRYDRKLAETIAGWDLDQPLPSLWPQFDALTGRPLLVIKGEFSDILSEKTLNEMLARNPSCQTHIVPGQGHAPFLRDAPTLDRIETFVTSLDHAD